MFIYLIICMIISGAIFCISVQKSLSNEKRFRVCVISAILFIHFETNFNIIILKDAINKTEKDQ